MKTPALHEVVLSSVKEQWYSSAVPTRVAFIHPESCPGQGWIRPREVSIRGVSGCQDGIESDGLPPLSFEEADARMDIVTLTLCPSPVSLFLILLQPCLVPSLPPLPVGLWLRASTMR